MKHLKITTAELSKICGVSQGTVDRALNNRSDISAETKKRIINVARQYGYREYVDSNSENKIIGQVGIIVFNLNNEYFSKLITETELVLHKLGLSAVIMITHYDKQYEIECIRNMYNMGVQGIVLCSVNRGREFDNYLRLFDIPIVAVGNNIGSVPYVGIDDFSAMRDMTAKVIADGYTDLIYFSPALKYADAYAQKLRYSGFLSAVPNRKHKTVTDMEEISESYKDKTAIICSTDYYAFQVYVKARNVKIVGFDDLEAIEKYKIRIDSVGYSLPEIARLAVDIIVGKRDSGVIIKHSIIEHT
ncbi:MAG: LacI family DNA-binding transcriptional regulator [Eubacteriales bacterium]|nr:LacI family DNA-binding transcriptional regulator [Eubacteriales bacterium]